MDQIIGMMWNRNEGDILEEIIEAALPHVDSMFIADDGSTDNSWNIIQFMAARRSDKIELIRNERTNSVDRQRTPMLNEIRRRYKPENTWVQIVESDVVIVDTDLRKSLKTHSVGDIAMTWQLLNAVRRPGTWKEVDTYPNWTMPIKQLMPYQHRLEKMLYTFRPLPKLYWDDVWWRPWPKGFSNYMSGPVKVLNKTGLSPLLGHYGYRGPTHYYMKMNPDRLPNLMSRNGVWDFSSPESVERTVPFFNGGWNKPTLSPMGRTDWKKEVE